MPTNPKPRDVSAEVGVRLRALRQSHGMALREVAQYSGITLTALSKIETGKRLVTVEDIDGLRHCFGIPNALYLLGLS